jgi:hypothetical protein
MNTAQPGISMSASQAYREKMFNLLAKRKPFGGVGADGIHLGRYRGQAFGDGASHLAI